MIEGFFQQKKKNWDFFFLRKRLRRLFYWKLAKLVWNTGKTYGGTSSIYTTKFKICKGYQAKLWALLLSSLLVWKWYNSVKRLEQRRISTISDLLEVRISFSCCKADIKTCESPSKTKLGKPSSRASYALLCVAKASVTSGQ